VGLYCVRWLVFWKGSGGLVDSVWARSGECCVSYGVVVLFVRVWDGWDISVFELVFWEV
jgi:hypothetical protein